MTFPSRASSKKSPQEVVYVHSSTKYEGRGEFSTAITYQSSTDRLWVLSSLMLKRGDRGLECSDSRSRISQRFDMDSQRVDFTYVGKMTSPRDRASDPLYHVVCTRDPSPGTPDTATAVEYSHSDTSSVISIYGLAIENQVKFATCTMLGAALTWWNGQMRTLGPEAYAMTWEFVANETEKVDKYISGLPNNIYGNVKSARPKTRIRPETTMVHQQTTLQEAKCSPGLQYETGNGNRTRLGLMQLGLQKKREMHRETPHAKTSRLKLATGENPVDIKLMFKSQEYMAKGCQVFLAQISAKKEEDKSERKQIKDVPIVRDFPKVFPEDLPGLPPARPVEFQIDLIPGAGTRKLEHQRESRMLCFSTTKVHEKTTSTLDLELGSVVFALEYMDENNYLYEPDAPCSPFHKSQQHISRSEELKHDTTPWARITERLRM
ncbi:hypothetical protein Tco_0311674 [Tanacetum coccineum]